MNRAQCLALVKATPMAGAVYQVPRKHHTRLSVAAVEPATPAPAPSLGDVSARPVDMHGLRRVLPQRWGELCRRHFRNSLELAVFFDTDEKTARNWLHDKHAPASAFVLRAIAAFPDAMPCLFEGDC